MSTIAEVPRETEKNWFERLRRGIGECECEYDCGCMLGLVLVYAGVGLRKSCGWTGNILRIDQVDEAQANSNF